MSVVVYTKKSSLQTPISGKFNVLQIFSYRIMVIFTQVGVYREFLRFEIPINTPNVDLPA